MGWFTNFVSEVTGDSTGKVSEAHHQARSDSGVHKGEDKQHFERAPDWAPKTTDSGTPLFPKDKS